MKSSTWNPTKRNRNIGTSKQGHGQNNKLLIPQPFDTSKLFYERFNKPEINSIHVHGREIPVIVEQLNINHYYSCTPADVAVILDHLPQIDLEEFGVLVFRQPKKKEQILSPVWGRLIYSFEFRNKYYPAIILEALPYKKKLKFTKRQTTELEKEFNHLLNDGVEFILDKREYVAEINEETARSIQLYRTLLHEVGHYVHYLEQVERPVYEEDICEWEKRFELYLNIPVQEKEIFANKYADTAKRELVQKNIIPFNRLD